MNYMASVMHQRKCTLLQYTLKTVYHDGSTVTIQFIAAKTRVAAIKKQSIPRMECLGATILAY